MKAITVASQKGGTGKTTIAINIAICALHAGLKVVLVNTDTQPSLIEFASVRFRNNIEPLVPVTNKEGGKVHVEIKKYSKADLVIIDSGGKDSSTFRSSIAAADLLIIPVIPSQLDIWATETTCELARQIQEAKDTSMEIRFLINQQRAGTLIGKRAVETLASLPFEQFNTSLYSRNAFKVSIEQGKGVIELNDKKAKEEVNKLWTEILAWFNGGSYATQKHGEKH